MPNQLGLGRAYVAGDLDAEGDFIAMVEALRDVTAEDLRFRQQGGDRGDRRGAGAPG